jgi:hypothetical protein
MSVDKTLSELWHLRGNIDVVSFEELQEKSSDTAFVAICTIQNLQEEVEKLRLINKEFIDKIDKLESLIEDNELDFLPEIKRYFPNKVATYGNK